MSNKSQMLCVPENVYNRELLIETWIRLKRDYKKLEETRREKRELIVALSSIEPILGSEYLYLRLRYTSVTIQAIKNSIKENLESIRIFSKRLVIC